MPVGGVIQHQVQNDADAAPVRLGRQPVEVLQRAETRVHGGVIADIVTEISIGRGIERGKPDGVNAKLGKVIETRRDAGQVAEAVAVAVSEGARVDLVDDAVAPPEIIVHIFLSGFLANVILFYTKMTLSPIFV